MKTTLILDDDIADFLQEQSRIQDKPLQRVVNETLRLGITRMPKRAEDAAKPSFRVKPNKSGLAEGVEPLHLNRLLDELEVENYLAGNETDISPTPDAMSLEAAYGSVKPTNSPEDFNEITAIAKQAKAEETAQELNDEWNS
ncbi:MAG: hypothetical protein OXI16_11995 [Chloroflexota bacterium]|nr:hypothetical protein [Chloroflexota bacterium]